MDTTRPVTYRGVNLNDGAITTDGITGTIIQRVEWPGVRGVGYTEKRANSDGRNASDVWQEARRIKISAVTHALSRGDLYDRMQINTAALTPRGAYVGSPGDKGYLPLGFYLPTARKDSDEWPAGEIQCFINARPLAQPSYILDRDATGGDDNDALAIPWSVEVEAIDPRIYIVPRVDTVCTASGSIAIKNRGTYPTPVNAILIVPAGSGTTFTLTGGGDNMTLTIPTDPLQREVRISSTDQVVTSKLGSGAETVAMHLINKVANRTWTYAPPGEEITLTWTTTTGLVAGSLLWFYEALA